MELTSRANSIFFNKASKHAGAHTLSHLTVLDYCSNFLGLGLGLMLGLGLTLTLTLTLILTLLGAIVYEPQHAKQSSVSDKHTAGRKHTRTSSNVSFDFKLCFYCSKPTSECKRDEWHCVEMLEMRETIMQAVLTRPDDPWELEIS